MSDSPHEPAADGPELTEEDLERIGDCALLLHGAILDYLADPPALAADRAAYLAEWSMFYAQSLFPYAEAVPGVRQLADMLVVLLGRDAPLLARGKRRKAWVRTLRAPWLTLQRCGFPSPKQASELLTSLTPLIQGMRNRYIGRTHRVWQ